MEDRRNKVIDFYNNTEEGSSEQSISEQGFMFDINVNDTSGGVRTRL